MPTQELIDGEYEIAPGRDGHLLEVQGLHVEFHTRDGVANAINGVDLYLDEGETLAVLGESGSGKSVTAQAVMGILDMPPAKIPAGRVLFRGRDMLQMKAEERRRIRGPEIAMIFQDAAVLAQPGLPGRLADRARCSASTAA